MKKSLLEDATSLVKLANVDPQLNVNQKENESVDSGFGVKAVVSDLRKKYVQPKSSLSKATANNILQYYISTCLRTALSSPTY